MPNNVSFYDFCYTQKLGNFRENRVKNFVSKNWKWKCYKSIEQIDKYHDVDLIAWDKNNQLIFIQVKGLSMINKIIPSPKAINFASLHNAILYYFFVGREDQKIYVKRIKW